MSIRALLRAVVVCGGFGIIPQLFASGITNPSFTPCSGAGIELNSLLSPGAGCTLGGAFTASNFGFSASAGAPLGAADITIIPSVMTLGGIVVLLDFNFSTTGGFVNSGATDIKYTFDYTIDPARPIINGASLGLDPGGVLTEDICAGGTYTPLGSGFTCPPVAALVPSFTSILVTTTALPNAMTAFPTGFTTVDYHLVLDLPPGTSAASFDSRSVTALGDDAGVPEPSSTLLGGAGLLALLGFRSRAKLRKVALQLFS